MVKQHSQQHSQQDGRHAKGGASARARVHRQLLDGRGLTVVGRMYRRTPLVIGPGEARLQEEVHQLDHILRECRLARQYPGRFCGGKLRKGEVMLCCAPVDPLARPSRLGPGSYRDGAWN